MRERERLVRGSHGWCSRDCARASQGERKEQKSARSQEHERVVGRGNRSPSEKGRLGCLVGSGAPPSRPFRARTHTYRHTHCTQWPHCCSGTGNVDFFFLSSSSRWRTVCGPHARMYTYTTARERNDQGQLSLIWRSVTRADHPDRTLSARCAKKEGSRAHARSAERARRPRMPSPYNAVRLARHIKPERAISFLFFVY